MTCSNGWDVAVETFQEVILVPANPSYFTIPHFLSAGALLELAEQVFYTIPNDPPTIVKSQWARYFQWDTSTIRDKLTIYPNLTFVPVKSKLKFGKINQTGNSALSEMFIFSLSPQLRFVWQNLGGSQWQKVRRNGIAMVAWLLHTSRSKERQNGIQRRPLLHCCINWMHHRIIYIRCKEASPVLHSNVNLMHYIMWDKVALIS